MRHDQAVAGKDCLSEPGLGESEVPEGLSQFAVAPGRHGEDELKLASALIGKRGEFAYILKAQQAAIGHQDDPLHREALQHHLQHRLQRLGLGHVARVNGVHQREPFGGLHDAKDELPLYAAGLFVQAEGAQIVVNLPLTMDAHGGQVVEDNRQIPIHERADLTGKFDLHHFSMIHQRIHRAQQMLMGHALGHRGHGHRLQPTQAAQLAVRSAEAVKDHRPDQRLGIDLAAPRPQCAAQGAVEAEVFPELVQRKDIAVGERRVIGNV
ncbi:hypothetical protein GALL_463030 [mine drainage metagenome]|uniref:Uncharacterized protein n=1 Tax=mine drainage metagenome TaxID=410659 RepID=A0A1J5PWY8_9ZZZZ